MLAANFDFQGFNAVDWGRVVDLFPWPLTGAHAGEGDRIVPTGGLIAIGRRDRLLRLLRVGEGPLPTGGLSWPLDAQALAQRLEAPWVIQIHPSSLLELQERFGARLRPTDALQDQWLKLLVAAQELIDEGAIHLWPARSFSWPALLGENIARSALELLCPPGKCLVLGAFAQGQLDTALVVRRGESGIDLVLGPSELRSQMGILSGDWFRDHAHLVTAVETLAGPVAGGCFGQTSCLKRLLAERKPGSFSQAVAARDLVLDPISPALAVSLGVDVGRAALLGMQSLTQRITESSFSKHPTVEKMKSGAFWDRKTDGFFGFDPLSAISKLILDEKDEN